jgi:uncharacterized protein (TIGR02678 family)
VIVTHESINRDVHLCAGALIDRPIVTAADDRVLVEKIRRHAPILQAAFTRATGWRLQAHPEFARLVKTPARPEASHALEWAKGRADYELAAWALWFCEHTGGRRFTVSQIAEEIRQRTTSDDGVPEFDWETRDQRLAIRRVFRGLEAMDVLRVLDGSVDEWAEMNGKRNALYEWGAAAWRLHVDLPSAVLERLAEGAEPEIPDPSAGAADEVRLHRALLLNPALFRRDDPAAFRVVADPERRRRVALSLFHLTGWTLEVTTAYARLLRPPQHDDTVQTPIPVLSGIAHAVLCYCGVLRARAAAGGLVPCGDECFLLHESRIERDVAELQGRHGEKWGKGVREQSVRSLSRDVVAEMKGWGLLRGPDDKGQYVVMPTAARLAAHYADDDAEGEGRA